MRVRILTMPFPPPPPSTVIAVLAVPLVPTLYWLRICQYVCCLKASHKSLCVQWFQDGWEYSYLLSTPYPPKLTIIAFWASDMTCILPQYYSCDKIPVKVIQIMQGLINTIIFCSLHLLHPLLNLVLGSSQYRNLVSCHLQSHVLWCTNSLECYIASLGKPQVCSQVSTNVTHIITLVQPP